MDFVLAGVALASLLLATGMGLVAWKLLRDSRRLSVARAEALATLAWSDDADDVDAEEVQDVDAVRHVPAAAIVPVAPTARAWNDRTLLLTPRLHATAPEGSLSDLDSDLDDAAGPPADVALIDAARIGAARIDDARIDARFVDADATPMFRSVVTNGQGRWLVAAAAGCAVLAAGAAGVIAFRQTGVLEYLNALTSVGATPRSADGPMAPAAPPLDLLTLDHTIEPDGTFVVAGLVKSVDRVPPAAIVAVVYLFDDTGTLLANADGPLERATLAPGEESAFLVRVAPSTPARIARYRIGFRTDGTGVVPHRDARPRTPPSDSSAPPASGQPRAFDGPVRPRVRAGART